MLGYRRLLLIGAVFAGFLVIATFATLMTEDMRDPEQKVCNEFLGYVSSQKHSESYNMFTASAKSLVSSQEWRERVISLEYIYKGGELVFNNKVDASPKGETSIEEHTQIGTRTQLNYTMKHPAATSSIECITIGNEGKQFIDGFVSAEKQSSKEQTQ